MIPARNKPPRPGRPSAGQENDVTEPRGCGTKLYADKGGIGRGNGLREQKLALKCKHLAEV